MGVMVDNMSATNDLTAAMADLVSAEIAFTADVRGDGREPYVVDSAVITGSADWLLPAISLTFSILVWAIHTWLLQRTEGPHESSLGPLHYVPSLGYRLCGQSRRLRQE